MEVFLAALAFLVIMIWLIKTSLSKPPTGNKAHGRIVKFGHLPEGDVLADGESWIYIQSGTANDVAAALKSYSDLGSKDSTIKVTAEIHESSSGVKLKLSSETPAYYFANMIGWLNSPPEGNTKNSVGWYKSSNGDRYFLIPDSSDSYGANLLGASSAGVVINYYQPEGVITKSDKSVTPAKEPDHDFSHRITLSLDLEDLKGWGNPEFIVDD